MTRPEISPLFSAERSQSAATLESQTPLVPDALSLKDQPTVGFFAVIYPCPSCGEKAGTTYTGSVICSCGMLHSVCAACGVQADPCWHEYEHDACGCEKCHPEIHNKPVGL